VYIDIIILINICQDEQICSNFDIYFIKNIILERQRERKNNIVLMRENEIVIFEVIFLFVFN